MPKKESPYDPFNMQVGILSVPLLDELAKAKGKGKTAIRILIEINLEFPEGRAEAEACIKQKLPITGPAFLTNNSLFIATEATPRVIRSLVEWNHEHRRPIHRVWPDFKVKALLQKSLATIKADAATRTFACAGEEIVWAVIDSGIQTDHVHFEANANTKFEGPDGQKSQIEHQCFVPGSKVDVHKDPSGHGTHVAGIIAGASMLDPTSAEKSWMISSSRQTSDDDIRVERHDFTAPITGVAPCCKLVSLRVLDAEGHGFASATLRAIDYVQQVNSLGRRIRIHGVNLSLGHDFNPEWFGCGHSPLCTEVNRLVRSGVVVVVSAGNCGHGKQSITDNDGQVQRIHNGGMLMSIMDPGNAALPITVGATHRFMPHTYGVSWFSSKGPTGDGRIKPDLVAPGERIVSAAAGKALQGEIDRLEQHGGHLPSDADRRRAYIEQSGTSMAAPHVSGAIAAFLSARREFVGQPEEVKRVFLSTALDLQRERYLQGAGLLDLLKALQSV